MQRYSKVLEAPCAIHYWRFLSFEQKQDMAHEYQKFEWQRDCIGLRVF